MSRASAALAACAVLVAVAAPGVARRVSPTPAMFAPARAVAAAINTSRIAQLKGMFTRDATIKAGFAPFRWTGPTAGEDWLNAFDATMSRAGAGNIKLDVSPPAGADVTRDVVRYAAPITMTYDVGKKRVRRDSTWSIMLVKRGSLWLVSELAWASSH